MLTVVVVGGAWWLTSGAPGLPPGVIAAAPGGAAVDGPGGDGRGLTGGIVQDGQGRPDAVPPSAEVVALADEAFLSEEGRALLYANRVEVLDAASFAGRCIFGPSLRPAPAGGAVGCHVPLERSVVVYAPADPRARGFVVNTLAHETLHVAWVALSPDDRHRLTPLLETEIAAVPADDPIHEQIAGSVGTNPDARPTELFAYLGTQVWREGGLAPELEAVYARFVTDRAALVAVHTTFQGELDRMVADVEAAYRSVAEVESSNAQARAQHHADATAVESYRTQYDVQVAELAAMPVAERERLLLSWVWWDGTELPMAPADDTLNRAAELLARDDASLRSRDEQLRAAEAAAGAEHARVDALAEDLRALQAELDPASPTD
ncbi:hypothetical protein [Cellulomonas carbonis]|uniref:hypothetical protein n=1 Tax=Cellulomonas carbonis TaxID=1386092 RepID=UPI001664EBBA|nr:hypothetical protein [Cellulomonas carbonis]GGC02395.1 hypothetical protein GCM10010972_14160 [Cellulomonas carbonis]